MVTSNIGIVNSSSFGLYFPKHLERLSSLGKVERIKVDKNISGEILAQRLKGFQIIVASVTPQYDRRFFALNEEAVLISRHGIGVNNVDVEAATEAGVLVSRVPGAMERDSMAEHTVTLLLQVAREINLAAQAVKEDKWAERAKFLGMEIKGKKVGIIGLGNIGSRVAEILRAGFGVEVLAYDPYLSPEEIKAKGAKPLDLDSLLREADIITLHASLNANTHHMLGRREFALMKERVILVNTARGELIAGEALVESLEKGKMAGVGMDVVEGEPIGKEHPFLRFSNVVIVPHIGTYTRESLERMGDKVVEDVERLLVNKEAPKELVNPAVLKKPNRAQLGL